MNNISAKIFVTFIFISACLLNHAEGWTFEELEKANTAAYEDYMTETERDVIKYMNLARLYPQKFCQLELIPYEGNPRYRNSAEFKSYKFSCVAELLKRIPTSALIPNKKVFASAQCWAFESGERGITGHDRINCRKYNLGENCYYGLADAREIVLALLIDDNVQSLGHRANILNPGYKTTGAACASHSYYKSCCVIDYGGNFTQGNRYSYSYIFSEEEEMEINAIINNRTVPEHYYAEAQEALRQAEIAKREAEEARRQAEIAARNAQVAANEAREAANEIKERHGSGIYQSSNQQSGFYDRNNNKKKYHSRNAFIRYYDENKVCNVQWMHVGYIYNFTPNSHSIKAGLFSCRFGFFGISPVNFEVEVHPWNEQFLYRPEIKFYIPTGSKCAIGIYGGCMIDADQVYKNIKSNYEDSSIGIGVGWFAGLSFDVKKNFEIFVEYKRQIDKFEFYDEILDFNSLRVGAQIGF